MENDYDGIFAMIRRLPKYDSDGMRIGTASRLYEDMYFACKGTHDHILQQQCRMLGYISDWEDITDMKNPAIWINKVMAFLNGIQRDRDSSEKAFEKMKQLLLRTYPYVCRDMTETDKERLKRLLESGLL